MAGVPAGPPEGPAPTPRVCDGPWRRDGLSCAGRNPIRTWRRVAPDRPCQGLFRRIPRGLHRGARFTVRPAGRGARDVSPSSLRAESHFGGSPSGGSPDRDPCDRGRCGAPRHRNAHRDRRGKSARDVASPHRTLRAARRRRPSTDEDVASHRIVPAELHRAVERTGRRVRGPARPDPDGAEQSISSYRAPRHPALFRVGWNAIRPPIRNPLGGERTLRGPAALPGGSVPSLHRGRRVRFVRRTSEGYVGSREAGGLRHPRCGSIPQSDGNRPMPRARDVDWWKSRLPCVEIVMGLRPPSRARSSGSRILGRCRGTERAEDASPYLPVCANLVLVIVHRRPRLERGFRLRVKRSGGWAGIETELRETGLDLADHARVQRMDVLRILAIQQGHVVDVEDPDQLLDRFRMVVDSDVDPAVIEAAIAATVADDEESRRLLTSFVTARPLPGAQGREEPDRKIPLRHFECMAHPFHDVRAREEVSLACVIPADEVAGPWKALLPGVRGGPTSCVHDAGLPLRGFLVGLHETL